MPDRVAVFIDYQNAYKLAREAFQFHSAPHWYGQFDPAALGRELTARGGADRELVSVRCYRGMPESRKQPKGARACSRQIDAWAKLGVATVWRPLRYPRDWPKAKEQEKGVDVQLAIDYVMWAYEDKYDVGILFSGDTDQKPSLLAVEKLKSPKAIEVAAWRPRQGYPIRVSLRGSGSGSNVEPPCHMIENDLYDRVADLTDYTAFRGR